MSTRVLVVDDNEHFRRTVTELLTLRGFEVVGEASSGPEAVLVVESGCPDAALLDVNMPDEDGYAVSARLAAICPTTTIVLTSSEAEFVAGRTLRDCGAAAFVPKTELATTNLQELFHRPASGSEE